MKVLLISHTCISRRAGQPKAQWLGQIPGLELRVLVPHRWRESGQWKHPEEPLAPTFQFEIGRVMCPHVGPALWHLHWYPRLAHTLRTFQPDIIDLWEEPWGIVSAHTCWLRNRMLPKTKILSETEQNIDRALPLPFEKMRAYTLQNADYAVARSEEAGQVLRAKGYRGQLEVVSNAVDADLFRPLDREACRQELGVAGFVVGYVGRLVEEKGLMDMVEALPHCPADVNLVFVGNGVFQASLEQRAKALGIAARVKFMGARPAETLPSVMNALDVLMLPSRTMPTWKEQFGRVLIEAHACGIPVIGSDSGAIPDVVGEGGLIVPERQPHALAEAVCRLHAHPAECVAMGIAGRSQVEAHYTWERVALRMHAIYTKIAACT